MTLHDVASIVCMAPGGGGSGPSSPSGVASPNSARPAHMMAVAPPAVLVDTVHAAAATGVNGGAWQMMFKYSTSYDNVRQSVTEQKQKQKAWTDHKFGSNCSDPNSGL